MDWNKAILLAAECVVVVVLGTLVGLGRDSAVTDGLLAVCGAIVGVGAAQVISKK